MFYYKTSFFFRKKQYFQRKQRKTHLWEGMTFLRRGCLTIKINITFFVDIEILNIYHLTVFSKKKIYIFFSKITVKNYFWGMNIFEGTGRWTTKMNITFFGGNEVPTIVFKFFLQKTQERLT